MGQEMSMSVMAATTAEYESGATAAEVEGGGVHGEGCGDASDVEQWGEAAGEEVARGGARWANGEE